MNLTHDLIALAFVVGVVAGWYVRDHITSVASAASSGAHSWIEAVHDRIDDLFDHVAATGMDVAEMKAKVDAAVAGADTAVTKAADAAKV